VQERFPAAINIEHNITRRTFFAIAFCDACHKLLFSGHLCRTCGFKFHRACNLAVPYLCQVERIQQTYYQMLLASNAETSAGILQMPSDYRPGSNTRKHPKTLDR
ncbi:raf homolog serine/threonine-protein kinase Raf-like, partial [Diaphorina citri]|uniref:Raf homolog serine/threonine-protein kinase Raf-like n=1 Tax=Diaphorina citri TaxID=121845 RepID=A0A1S4ERV6_DIACI